MTVRVRLFAALRELVGEDELELDQPEGATVGSLWDDVVASHPELSRFEGSVQFAVNHDFVPRDQELNSSDEVAFLPPVSGG